MSASVRPIGPSVATLTGRVEDHLCSVGEASLLGARVHRKVVEPFSRLREEAREAGFDVRILSAFRGFEHQLDIWNEKARGQRPVLDSQARPLDIRRLSERELVFAILRWSALPGASRHHWGTDLDVYDQAARPQGYEIELVPEEVEDGGMFGPLHAWLDERIAANQAHGFFRPYGRDRGGVAPERWHLSWAPLAELWARRLTPVALRESLSGAEMELRSTVFDHLDEIVERFVDNTCPVLA